MHTEPVLLVARYAFVMAPADPLDPPVASALLSFASAYCHRHAYFSAHSPASHPCRAKQTVWRHFILLLRHSLCDLMSFQLDVCHLKSLTAPTSQRQLRCGFLPTPALASSIPSPLHGARIYCIALGALFDFQWKLLGFCVPFTDSPCAESAGSSLLYHCLQACIQLSSPVHMCCQQGL